MKTDESHLSMSCQFPHTSSPTAVQVSRSIHMVGEKDIYFVCHIQQELITFERQCTCLTVVVTKGTACRRHVDTNNMNNTLKLTLPEMF